MLSDAEKVSLEYDRLRTVFQHGSLSLSVTVINSILTARVLAPVVGQTVPVAWAAVIVVFSGVRWFAARTFLRRSVDVSLRPWTIVCVLGALGSGLLWGIGATVMFPNTDAYRLFLALVIGGMCAGAITVDAAHLPTAAAFVLPSSLLLAVRFLIEGEPWRVSALMIVVFAFALCLIGLRAHRAFGDDFRLRLALGREQRRFGEANKQLKDEVAHRHAAEATLYQMQKMEAIGHLTGGIAHDFNNLLQVVIGNLNLIRRVSDDRDRVVKYALSAEKAALRGAELTNSLLTFARRQSLEAKHVDLNALLLDFEPILLHTLGPAVQCKILLATDLPPCRADPAHFQSAVLNLVINARDAMPAGGRLSITTRYAMLGAETLIGNPDAAGGGFVGVSVRDTGLGMSAELMAHVFEPFFTTKETGKGSGLGLSQIYGFARQSGGHIQLHSAPDQGTEATLWLPVVGDDAPTVQTAGIRPSDTGVGFRLPPL